MHFEKGQTVGIDLGTTYSTLAQLDDEGNPVALPNEDGELETASLILLGEGGSVIVGPNRMRAAMEAPENVVERIKRHMGAHDFKRDFEGRAITPEFLAALILMKLRQDGEKRIGAIANAVITVPYYFNDARRKATQDAGRIAGLNVIDIINQPTAATLTYAWLRGELGSVAGGTPKPRKALVYDLGGGTFDVTVVQYTPAHFQVLATDGDVKLGGVDWTDRLVDRVAEEFKDRHGIDPRDSLGPQQVLFNDCDTAKHDLSEKQETILNFRQEGKAITVRISRSEFHKMTADLLQRTADTVEHVLKEAGSRPEDLDAVVMVGGSTLMPQVRSTVEELTGQKPFDGISPFSGVAQGAAIHAAILEAKHLGERSALADKVRKMLGAVRQENVNSHALGVVTIDPETGVGKNHVMIRRNTRIPAQVNQVFQTNKDNQGRVSIQVLEGDAPDPMACSLLGKCRVTDLPENLPKGSLVEVDYAFDTAGRITVTAREKSSGKEATIEIERRSGLDDEQVDAYAKLAAEYRIE
ncbi:MAG: Hsp70 family protein [Planctomycetota bacterium]